MVTVDLATLQAENAALRQQLEARRLEDENAALRTRLAAARPGLAFWRFRLPAGAARPPGAISLIDMSYLCLLAVALAMVFGGSSLSRHLAPFPEAGGALGDDTTATRGIIGGGDAPAGLAADDSPAEALSAAPPSPPPSDRTAPASGGTHTIKQLDATLQPARELRASDPFAALDAYRAALAGVGVGLPSHRPSSKGTPATTLTPPR
jgi:hypothetical protein